MALGSRRSGESVVGPGLGVHNLRGLAEIASDVLIAREETVLMAEVSGVGAPGPLGPFVAGFAGELSRQGYQAAAGGQAVRHTAAMRLLHAGVDTTVIALWLGHEQVETRQMYLHADLALRKSEVLARTKPLDSKPGRYRPPDVSSDFWTGSDCMVRSLGRGTHAAVWVKASSTGGRAEHDASRPRIS